MDAIEKRRREVCKSMLCPNCDIAANVLGKEDDVTFFICPVCRLIFNAGLVQWKKMS